MCNLAERFPRGLIYGSTDSNLVFVSYKMCGLEELKEEEPSAITLVHKKNRLFIKEMGCLTEIKQDDLNSRKVELYEMIKSDLFWQELKRRKVHDPYEYLRKINNSYKSIKIETLVLNPLMSVVRK